MPPKLIALHTPQDALNRLSVFSQNSEQLVVLFLNTENQLIKQQNLAAGKSHLRLKPRDIFAPAFLADCTGIIIAHNHPSGNSDPSDTDIEFTDRLARLGKELGIVVLDHLIVTKNSYFSFFEKGLLQ